MEKKPSFGKNNGGPPSFFARIPTQAITTKKLTDKEFRVLCVLCAYANNQGFAWPNLDTIFDDLNKLKEPVSRRTISRALDKLRRGKFIEVVSRHRSHEKWKHIMGTVHRVIYDERLTVDDLHDVMTKEDPPPIDVSELPKQPEIEIPEADQGKQENQKSKVELVEVNSLAQWYSKEAHGLTGQLKLVNEKAFKATQEVLAEIPREDIKAQATAYLMDCRANRKGAPESLGFLLKKEGVSSG